MGFRRSDTRVHLIASLGGHLELLQALSPVLGEFQRTWITSSGSRAASLAAGGEHVETIPRLDRGSLSLRGVLAGVRLALRHRPRCVVTSGAGLTVPYAVTARLLGARIIFLETMARVDSGSMSGKVLSRLGARVFVQWPELLDVYTDATLCRPLLLEGAPVPGGVERVGTFVTVGSHDAPFERLLQAVSIAVDGGVLPAPVLIQAGVAKTGQLPGEVVDFLSPEEFRAAVKRAAVVVTHGGAGAVATAIRAGRRPLVMSRSAARGEHVDDHQEQLIAKLTGIGAVIEIVDTIGADDVALAIQDSHGQLSSAEMPSLLDAVPQELRRSGRRLSLWRS